MFLPFPGCVSYRTLLRVLSARAEARLDVEARADLVHFLGEEGSFVVFEFEENASARRVYELFGSPDPGESADL